MTMGALRKHMATGSDTTMRFREEKSSIGPVQPGDRVHGASLVGALLGTLCMALVVPAHALDAPRPSNGKSAPTKGLPMPPADSAKPRVLEWDDLIPFDQRDRPFSAPTRARPLFDDESGPPASQEGSSDVNAGLDGQWVKLPGFVVPLSVNANVVSDFLLVPYFGACVHMPPPPPNQIVYVAMSKPFRLHSMYAPVWVTGKLSTKSASAGLAEAAYSLAGVQIVNYEE